MTQALDAWLALITLEAGGAGVLSILCSDLTRWGLVARLSLAFWLGQVALTAWFVLAGLLGLRPGWWLGVIALVIAWTGAVVLRGQALCGWLERSHPSRISDAPPWLRGLESTLAIFLLSAVAIVGAASVVEPLAEWDVVSFWALKAKVLMWEPLRSAAYFHDPSKAYSQVDYPLLWPMTIAWVWTVVGEASLDAVKWLAPATLCATAGLMYGLVRIRSDRAHALLFTALLLALPMEISQISRLSADAPFGCYVVGAFGCAYLWLRDGRRDDLAIAAAFAAGMLLTKNEGIAFFAVLSITLAVAVVVRGPSSRWREAAACLVAAPLALAGPWLVFRSSIPKTNIDYLSRLDAGVLWMNGGRVLEVVRSSLAYFADFDDWLLFWPTLALLLAIATERWLRSECAFLVLALALSFGAYAFAYVITPWELDRIMGSTANRLLLQVAPLSALLLSEVVALAAPLPWQARVR